MKAEKYFYPVLILIMVLALFVRCVETPVIADDGDVKNIMGRIDSLKNSNEELLNKILVLSEKVDSAIHRQDIRINTFNDRHAELLREFSVIISDLSDLEDQVSEMDLRLDKFEDYLVDSTSYGYKYGSSGYGELMKTIGDTTKPDK